MSEVLRWGRSAYETLGDLDGERAAAHALGLGWECLPDPQIRPGRRAEILVVTSKARVDAAAIDAVQPRLVLTTTSGYEHIDLDRCRQREIVVGRCPLARRDAVVEHAVGSLIRLLRRLPAQESPARSGRWARADLPEIRPQGLGGAPIAVVGLGVIGARVAEVLTALGASVLGVDPDPAAATPGGLTRVPLSEALRNAKGVTLHASATSSARGLLNAERLAALPRGCVVVNTARGDLMDPIAAARLVHQGHLGGLACDVFPEEPWPHLRDWAADDVLLTPHASGYTEGLGARVAAEVAAALRAWVQGEPIPARVA